jgi:hypothetical protein
MGKITKSNKSIPTPEIQMFFLKVAKLSSIILPISGVLF